MTLTASAPAKLILSGEHAVVYGYPALATALDLRLTCHFGESEVIESNIPIGGLGSSSALSVCRAVRALSLEESPLGVKNIANRALEFDREFHKKPSGVDTTICTYGGWVLFQKGKPIKRFRPKNKLPDFYLLNTGRPVESTADMVDFVAKSRAKDPKRIDNIFYQIGNCTDLLYRALQGRTLKWSPYIRQSELLLEQLGVVSASTQKIIRELESIGAAAKVTGAGGTKNGSGMVIVYHPDPKKLLDYAKKQKLKLIPVKLGQTGVKILLT